MLARRSTLFYHRALRKTRTYTPTEHNESIWHIADTYTQPREYREHHQTADRTNSLSNHFETSHDTSIPLETHTACDVQTPRTGCTARRPLLKLYSARAQAVCCLSEPLQCAEQCAASIETCWPRDSVSMTWNHHRHDERRASSAPAA